MHTSDQLANERTFLAWIRTSVAVVSLGFVIARFSFWLNELALTTGQHVQLQRTGLSLPIGLGMMAFGALLTVFSAYRYQAVSRAIDRGEFFSAGSLILAVTAATFALAVMLIVYLLVAAGRL